MNHANSIASNEAPENRADNRKATRLTATILSNGPLSSKEARVMRFIAEGLTQKQIAQRVNRSLSTINTQLEHIYRKLGAHNATHAVGIAISKGIVGLSILTLLVAIQVDNKNLIRPRNNRTGRTVSARSRRETDQPGSNAASEGNYFVVAGSHSGARGVFEYRCDYVAISSAWEAGGSHNPA